MPLSEESDPFARRHFAGSSGGETVPPWNGSGWNCAGGNCAAGLVPAACPRSAPPPPPGSTAARHHHAGREAKPEQQRIHRAACPGFFFCPSSRPAPAPALPRRRPDDDGGGLPDLPGLGGVGLPDEQRTARPITCPACSFQPDPAAALMTPPPCCPHPCQTYRQRQPPARQHPAASPTPEGSDSPPNGIWL